MFVYYKQGCASGVGCGRGYNTPPPPSFLKFVGILTKCVGKISRPNVVGKFGELYHKKAKSKILAIYGPAMTAFEKAI